MQEMYSVYGSTLYGKKFDFGTRSFVYAVAFYLRHEYDLDVHIGGISEKSMMHIDALSSQQKAAIISAEQRVFESRRR